MPGGTKAVDESRTIPSAQTWAARWTVVAATKQEYRARSRFGDGMSKDYST